MRARVIFQGLTLFKFDEPTAGAKAGDNMRTLTAYLVSDPHCERDPLHKHTPRMGVIGRDSKNVQRVAKMELQRHSPDESTTIQLVGHGKPTGVRVDGSFLDYVPCLSELHWKPRGEMRPDFVTAKIVIPSGRVRARNFIGWDWHGNVPARIGYMGTTFQGFGANEVVVEMGDDKDFDTDRPQRCLSVAGPGVNERLRPSVKGAPSDESIEPNTVEVLITNLPARRLRAAPHGLHFETICYAAGYPPDEDRYVDTDQYRIFDAAMRQYDADAWSDDVRMMGIGQPFPYLINPGCDLVDPLRPSGVFPMAMVPPPMLGRRPSNDMPLGGTAPHKKHGGMSMGHDPDNTQICPHGRE